MTILWQQDKSYRSRWIGAYEFRKNQAIQHCHQYPSSNRRHLPRPDQFQQAALHLFRRAMSFPVESRCLANRMKRKLKMHPKRTILILTWMNLTMMTKLWKLFGRDGLPK
mmetsp:Transcript_121408/g.350541  ORF Transcript_121408/g.350541 Transcript_121408/m.350541 type:complete len:110 (+) Transcript_121408:180-509(+)